MTGLDELWLEGVNVYPNPAQRQLTVALAEGINPVQASMVVYSAEGRVMLEQDAEGANTTLKVDSLPAGMYLLKVTAGDRMATLRFQIAR
ncbi:MAG TPA: hypothetical protein DCR93_34775 [Cytophagales bacterium]|nr:hypothetical protein [Cytophagales bacterium]